jgi:hypothetical protein
MRYDWRRSPSWADKPKYYTNMKNEVTTLAVTLSLMATAIYLLSRVHSAISADSVVGFGAVAVLLAVAAVEYRISWKKLTGR